MISLNNIICRAEKEKGIRKNIEGIIGKPELEVLPQSNIYKKGFSDLDLLFQNRQEIVRRLNEKYDPLYCISSQRIFLILTKNNPDSMNIPKVQSQAFDVADILKSKKKDKIERHW